MKYTKKVWIPILVLILLVVVIIGFAFINSISKPEQTLDREAKQVHSAVIKADGHNNKLTSAPDMDGIETDAMIKDINENGTLPEIESAKTSVTASTLKNIDKKDNIEDFVKSLGIDDNDNSTKAEEKVLISNKPEKDFQDEIPVGIEKGGDFDNQLILKKQPAVNLTETYNSPYFTVNYPAADWDYAEGKSLDLPSFVNIPKKTAVATVEFFNKKNGNSIFLHISHSGGADLNKMTPSETKGYLRYIYNDARIERVPIEYINNMRFAVLKFVPRNNKLYLVKQYLTTKNNYLYCITFIEKKSSEINQKMINAVLGSMLVQ